METKIGFIGQGETVWETVARPCLVSLELANRDADKVYSFCRKG